VGDRRMDCERLISGRARGIEASGIRRIFTLGSTLDDPNNLSIGQPDFPVPETIKRAAIEAIEDNRNGYTLTGGIEPLRSGIARALERDVGWRIDGFGDDQGDASLLVTSGTSGAIVLAFQSLLDPGDEVIIPDPYFIMYPPAAELCGGRAVRCDTYPDFRMTAERVEPLITERTKAVLFNSPSNPAGVVSTRQECADLLDLCRRRGVLLISDEIYDEFTYSDAASDREVGTDAGGNARARCPSPARLDGASESVLLVRGFGKTYGVTGWRLGYASGPSALIEQMAKIQQYTFVCAPSVVQWGAVAALDADMSAMVNEYERRRDMVVDRLGEVTEVARPGGAFYAFVRVPDRLGLTAGQFVERCIDRKTLVIPGSAFSAWDTHIRLSFATDPFKLERGLDVLVDLMGG